MSILPSDKRRPSRRGRVGPALAAPRHRGSGGTAGRVGAGATAILVVDAGQVVFANAAGGKLLRTCPRLGGAIGDLARKPAGEGRIAISQSPDERLFEVEWTPVIRAGRSMRRVVVRERSAESMDAIVEDTRAQDGGDLLLLFRKLATCSADGIVIVNPSDDFEIVFSNPAGARILGCSVAEILHRPLGVIHPRFAAGLRVKATTVLQAGNVRVFVMDVRNRGGATVRVEASLTRLRHERRDLIAVTLRDVTENRRASGLLAETQSLARIGGWEYLIDEDRLTWTEEVYRIHDLVAGTPVTAAQSLGYCHPESRPRFERAVRAGIEDGQPWQLKLRIITAQGREVWVQTQGRADLLDGRPWRLLGTVQEITSETNNHVAEEQRVEPRLVLAQRREGIGVLAGGIAHDLNNILAPIILSADILAARNRDREESELVESIGISARRGADVVRQILSFARGVESTRAPVNVQHLLRELKPAIRESFPDTITCRITSSPDLWPIHADPSQIHQVLLNLCANARDAMPAGGNLTIEATNVVIDEYFTGMIGAGRPGPHLQVTVTDDGIGIDESIRPRLFDPFFTTKTVGAASGLGLSTVLAIVRSHHGFLTIDTGTGGPGTAFSVYFPAEPGRVGDPPLSNLAELPRGNGELILVIDDEKGVCSIITQALESAGYRVVATANGAAGLAAYARRPQEFSLVLTDLVMPVMDGVATIRALRHLAANTRIVAMSGISQNPGAAGPPLGSEPHTRFLLKPFTLESLLQTVRESLDEQIPDPAPLP